MKYEVKKVETTGVTVEFEDKAWAVVPVLKGDTDKDIMDRISTFETKQVFTNVEDIPIKVGYKGDTYPTDDGKKPDPDSITYTYKQVRQQNYPSIGDQLDALHWAREGDDTNLKAIDVAIKAVKDKYPKDNKEYKQSDL